MKKVAIIGTGVAGLAAAVRMAVRGHEVHVFEANSYPGGKLSEIEVGKYRFDAGPSLFTMPEYLEELFALAGKRFEDYCPYDRLDPITHYFFPDGTRFNSHADADQFAHEMETTLGVKKHVVKEHLQNSKKIFELTSTTFLHRSIHTFQNITSFDLLRIGSGLGTLDLFSTMHQTNEKRLKHPKLVQYFNRFATYNGSNPYEAPGTLNIIPHLEHHIGAFFPRGGMYAITKAIYQLATELGVHFHFNTRVNEIIIEKNKVTGVTTTDGTFWPAALVVSNMDVMYTYKKLLPHQKHPDKTLNQPRALSAMVFYLGIKKEFPQLGLHNIFFSENYKKEFDVFFKDNSLAEDLTVYINISSKFKKDDAPEGCENWFVMINTPPNTGQDWDKLVRDARKNILAKLSRVLGEDIESLIDAEDVLEPRIIEQKTSSYQGSLYGSSSNNKFAAFLRHANFSNTIKGLYFCGGSVHPGGGIPLSVLSAKIVDELIHKK
jgi:phytoene desaturase